MSWNSAEVPNLHLRVRGARVRGNPGLSRACNPVRLMRRGSWWFRLLWLVVGRGASVAPSLPLNSGVSRRTRNPNDSHDGHIQG